MQNLMEHDHGWEDLCLDFINKVGDQKVFPSSKILVIKTMSLFSLGDKYFSGTNFGEYL
jgi:hypothetical protein